MQTAKHTAWKKSRTFGDVFGGRQWPKLADKVLNRQHNLLPPAEGQQTPVFTVDNPSAGFYFPVTTDEIRETLQQLPAAHTERLTHIWLRKIRKKDYLDGKTLQGCFICGSGVNLIILHPFPIDQRMRFGRTRPDRRTLRYYRDYSTDLKEDGLGWYLQWTAPAVRQYYLQSLLLHEIGHCIDSVYKKYWSKAGNKRREDFAAQYAAVWANAVRAVK